MNTKLQCIAAPRCSLGESPLWSPSRSSLFWLDIGEPSNLYEWRQHDSQVRSWKLSQLATALVLSRDDELIIVAQDGIHRFDTGRGELRQLAPIAFAMQRLRFNDGGCDRQGRLWVGTMPNDFAGEAPHAIGDIWRIDPDLSFHLMAEGFGCPNTFAWQVDDSTMYLADSARGDIYAYSFDQGAGTISDRRVFAAPKQLGIPDGSAMDTEGCLWNARWGGGCVARFSPDGQVIQTVSIPASQVTSCAFGGDHLETLYVTTARCGLSEQQLVRQPLAGGIFSIKPGPVGLPPGRFRLNISSSDEKTSARARAGANPRA